MKTVGEHPGGFDNVRTLVQTAKLPEYITDNRAKPSMNVDALEYTDNSSAIETMDNFKEYMLPTIHDGPELYMAGDFSDPGSTMPQSLSFLSFNLHAQSPCVHVMHLPLDVDQRVLDHVSIAFPRGRSVKSVYIGPLGRRAIWIEQDWETESIRMMKMHYPAEDPNAVNTGVLLPPQPSLPFTPEMCKSLAFDELTGRLCLGLMNGDLWILDFA